jgi:ornithine cyclodeaminase/alanine dehydrogenase-like protein (mu-crystallin family)
MEEALRALSAGEVIQPVRTMIPVEQRGGFLWSMPAYAGAYVGVKLVTFFPNNDGLPTHHAVVSLFSAETGAPLATMDGGLITEMRTGAVSAVATKCLAREDSSTLAILGSGAQARSHLEALRLVRRFTDTRVWSPRNCEAFADEHGITAATSAEEAVRWADVVVVATTSRTPVLKGAWLKPGAHINAVGAALPDWRELDDDVMRRAKLFVESRDAASQESGDVRAAKSIHAEIGEVIAGKKPGRASPAELTLFKSVGCAVEDVASAALIYLLAR